MDTTMLPEAVEHDDRGADGVSYGYVYFNDGMRVTYASGLGVSTGSGGRGVPTEFHRKAAVAYLDEHLPVEGGWQLAAPR